LVHARDNRCAKVEGMIIIKPFGDSRARVRERERERDKAWRSRAKN